VALLSGGPGDSKQCQRWDLTSRCSRANRKERPVIPSFQLDDIVFSDTYARFAADLLADVRRSLLTITTRLDWSLRDNGPGSPSYRRAEVLSVDKPALVAAAAYAQWIGDHVAYEVAQWRDHDMRRAELAVCDEPDKVALYRHERDDLELVSPSFEPPMFPDALQAIHRTRELEMSVAAKLERIEADRLAGRSDLVEQGLADMGDHGHARRLNGINETLNEALAAMGRNETKKSACLRAHAEALTAWARNA
jgi:hypothetical protein